MVYRFRSLLRLSTFSQNLIFKKKPAESPRFLTHDVSDRSEIFSASTRNTLAVPTAFFYFEKYCTVEFCQILHEKH